MTLRKRLPQSALGGVLRERFARNVRDIRKHLGITQDKLANAAGLGRVFINQVERGHSSVTLETVAAIATALGVRPAALISSQPYGPDDGSEAQQELRAEIARTPAGRRG